MLPSWKRILQLLIAITFVYWIIQPTVAVANGQTLRHAALADFTAILANQGIAIQWQANGDSVDWNFTLYRSQTCQFEGAVEVTAPIFSSISDETNIAHYSANDTAEPVVATCAYWLVATDGDSQQRHFGPYEVQGRTAVYLPLVVQ
jgi:hypothetical protein